MRACQHCAKADRPQLDNNEQCSCSAESHEPMHHGQDCKALIHEVMLYPVRIAQKDLTFDCKLPPQYAGWTLMQNGNRWYRYKFLCRDCIGKYEDAQKFRRDYLQACKKARGEEDQTYSQMLAGQSFI